MVAIREESGQGKGSTFKDVSGKTAGDFINEMVIDSAFSTQAPQIYYSLNCISEIKRFAFSGFIRPSLTN
jgi:hypothetical protein